MTDSTRAVHTIRKANERDANEIARLLTVLGHPTAADTVTARWREWSGAGNAAFVAQRTDGTLAGVATLHHMVVLHRPKPVGRVTSLVVDAAERGSGIGRALVAAAEAELLAAGCGLLEVTSNMKRAEAHAFYERLGYERTSFRFAKTLAPGGQ